MSSVELTCPTCGTTLPLNAATAQLSRFPHAEIGGCVAVGCPGCARRWSVEVDAARFDDLMTEGCDLAPDLASRARHPAGRARCTAVPAPDGPPISRDDLLDFHLLLQRNDWFDQLCALERSA